MSFRRARPYVNTEWLEGNRSAVSIKSPYSQEVIGEQIIATPEDVEQALSAAYEAKNNCESVFL